MAGQQAQTTSHQAAKVEKAFLNIGVQPPKAPVPNAKRYRGLWHPRRQERGGGKGGAYVSLFLVQNAMTGHLKPEKY